MANQNLQIDDLFLRELAGHTEVPPADVWTALEKRLDDNSKKRPLGWWWSTLLLLVIATGAYFGKGLLHTFAPNAATTNISTSVSTPANTNTTTPVNTTNKTENTTADNTKTTEPDKQTAAAKTIANSETKKEISGATQTTNASQEKVNKDKFAGTNAPATENKKQLTANDKTAATPSKANKETPALAGSIAATSDKTATNSKPVATIPPSDTKKKAGTVAMDEPATAGSQPPKNKQKTSVPVATAATTLKAGSQNNYSATTSSTSSTPIVKSKPVKTIKGARTTGFKTSTAIIPAAIPPVTTPPLAAATQLENPTAAPGDSPSTKMGAKAPITTTAAVTKPTSANALTTSAQKPLPAATAPVAASLAGNKENKNTIVPNATTTDISAPANKNITAPATLSGSPDSTGNIHNALRYSIGLKAAYNFGSRAFSMNGFVISGYLKLSLSEKISLLFQPGLKLNHFGSGPFNTPQAYIDDKSPSLGPPDATSYPGHNIYSYTHVYDSIRITNSLTSNSSTAFELPILFNYNISDRFSVYLGPAFSFGKIPEISKDQKSFPTVSISGKDTVASTVTLTNADIYKMYHTSPEIGTYDSAQYQNPTKNSMRTSLMLGAGYMANDRLEVDFSLHFNISDLGFIPNDNIKSLYSQTYIRIGIGYRLFGNAKTNISK